MPYTYAGIQMGFKSGSEYFLCLKSVWWLWTPL